MNAQQKVARATPDQSVIIGWGLFCFTLVAAVTMVALYIGLRH